MKTKDLCLLVLSLSVSLLCSAAYAANDFYCPGANSVQEVQVGDGSSYYIYQATLPDGKIFREPSYHYKTLDSEVTSYSGAYTEGQTKGDIIGVVCVYNTGKPDHHAYLFLEGNVANNAADIQAPNNKWVKIFSPVQYVCSSTEQSSCPFLDNSY